MQMHRAWERLEPLRGMGLGGLRGGADARRTQGHDDGLRGVKSYLGLLLTEYLVTP